MAADDYLSQDEIDDLDDWMKQAGWPSDRRENILQAVALNPDLYDRYWKAAYQDAATNPSSWPRPLPDYPGLITLGTDPDGRPVGISQRQLNEHMLVVGRTGAGKTTFFYTVMEKLDDRGVPFLAFDFKNDYRDVADDLDLTVVNWRDLKFNPLQPPPGVSTAKWGEIVAETFAHATDLLIGSESYFLEKLRQLYGLYTDTDAIPSLFELRDLVRAHEVPRSSPKFDYKERVDGRLTMMTGFSGDIFDCSRGHAIEELLDRNVVFELQEPNQYTTNFVVETLLTWIFYYRDAQGHRDQLRHAILFDEAKRVFDVNREEQPESGYPPIDDLMGKIRAFGEAMVVADHEPSKLTDSLKANTNVKLWMSLGSGHDVEEMADTFGIEDEKVDYTYTLERGEGVVVSAENDPVPVDLPPYTVDEPATVDEVRARTEAVLDDLSYRERVRPDLFESLVGDVATDDAEQESDEESSVGEVAEALLASVNEQPFLSLSDRYDVIDVGKKKGNRARNELLTLDLVREVEVRTGTRGRNPKMLELTQDGHDVLEERGYDVMETGRRGIEHRYWQQQVKEHYETDGFDVVVEHAVDDGRIDVYAEHGDREVAVEVACSAEHELENIEKCLNAGVDRVQVVYIEDRVKSRIASAVRDEFGKVPDAVEFVPASEFA